MTAPYRPELADLLAGPLEHHSSVQVVPVSGEPFELPVSEGGLSVTFSEDWSPHVQANLAAPMLPTAQLDKLDPRAGCRLRIQAGYILPTRETDVHLLADLGLMSRVSRRPDNTLALSAGSAEDRLQGAVFRSTQAVWSEGGLNETVQKLLSQALHPQVPKLVSEFPAGYKSGDTNGLELFAGDDYFKVLEDLAAATETWIYCDGAGVWRLRRRPAYGDTPKHLVATGERGTVTQYSAELSRSQWYNDVVIQYRWKNGISEQNTIGRASISSGPLRPAVVGRKTLYVSKGTGTTQAKANQAARTMVSNLITRGRELNLTAAAAYWLRPGDTVTVRLETGADVDRIIQSITFRPLDGLMDLTTRLPNNETITTGE